MMGNLLALEAAFPLLNSLKVIKLLLILDGNLFPYNIYSSLRKEDS